MCIRFNQLQWLNPYVEFNTKKRRSTKIGGKDGKVLYKLMSNAVYDKEIENLRNRIDVRLENHKRDYLKWISKPSYLSQKIFNYVLVVILERKFTLKF